MAHASRPHRRRHRGVPRSHQHKSLLRFITCGSVDDGKSTLIGRLLYESHLVFEDHLAALEADSAQGRHPGRRPRLRAAGRRPHGRARAGHHDRRRLPVLLHRAPQVHRRRHPGPRAVHPQHGHRRVDRRPRRDPDRRPQGRAHPDPPPQLPRVAARHQAGRGRRSTSSTSSTTRRRCSTPSTPRTTASFAAQIGLDDITCIPMSALRGDNITEPSANTPWYDGPTLIGYLETVDGRRRGGRRTVPHAGAVGQPPEPRLPRILRHASSAARSAAATRSASCRRDRRAPSPASSRSTATSTRPVAGQSVTLTLADEIDVSRGDVSVPPATTRRGRRPVRGPRRLDARGPHAARPALPAEDRHPHRRRHARPAEVQGQRQHPRAPRRDARSSSTRSACATSASTGRSPFDPYADNRDMGGFIIIDQLTNATVGAGLLHFALRRSQNIHWQDVRRRQGRPRRAQGTTGPRSCGSPGSPAPASRPSPTSSKRNCTRSASTPTCSTATTSATASTATSASPTPTASRTSAASPRCRRSWSTPA